MVLEDCIGIKNTIELTYTLYIAKNIDLEQYFHFLLILINTDIR